MAQQNILEFLQMLQGPQAQVESGGNDYAVSPAGAQGRFQIMPATARDPGFGVAPLRNWDGINPMSAPLAEQTRFRNDYQNMLGSRYKDPTTALMAYNAGPGTMDKVVSGEIPYSGLARETQEYPGRVYSAAGLYPVQRESQQVDITPTQAPPSPKDTVAQILSQRFSPEPSFTDVANSAFNSALTGKYASPKDIANAGLAGQLEILGKISEYKKNLASADYYSNGGAAANAVKPVFNPATGQMEYVSTAQLAGGNYRPPAPSGQQYTPDGRLIRNNPSVRDEMRIAKSSEAAKAAVNVERLANEAMTILNRYETNRLAPLVGKTDQWLAATIGVDDATRAKLADYERLNSISKDLGAQALQQFGGNDTDKELQIAISTGVDPNALVETNMNIVRRKLAAAQVWQQLPAFQEEWLNKAGSLNSPDPETGKTFTQTWLDVQKRLYNEALGAAPASPVATSPTISTSEEDPLGLR